MSQTIVDRTVHASVDQTVTAAQCTVTATVRTAADTHIANAVDPILGNRIEHAVMDVTQGSREPGDRLNELLAKTLDDGLAAHMATAPGCATLDSLSHTARNVEATADRHMSELESQHMDRLKQLAWQYNEYCKWLDSKLS